MGSFGFFAGGLASGISAGASIGRQAVMDNAYLKLQAKNQAMMERLRDQQAQTLAIRQQTADEAPYEKVMGVAPEETGAAINAVRAFRGTGKVPTTGVAPTTPDVGQFQTLEGGTLPQTNDLGAIKQAPFKAAGDYIRQKHLEDLAKESAQTQRLGEQTDLQRRSLESNEELKRLMLENRMRTQDPAYKASVTRATKEASGVRFGPDGIQLKPLNVKEQEDLASLKDARDTFMSLREGIQNGAFPKPGYAQSKMNELKEKFGSFVPNALLGPNQSLDDPRMTGYFKFIKTSALDRLKAIGGVRAAGSPTELRATQAMFAQPENSPGGLEARINSTASQLERAYEEHLKGHKANHKDVGDYENLAPNLLSPEEIMGVRPQTGTATLPGRAPIPIQPGGATSLPGNPLNQAFPGAVRPLGFKPMYPGQ